MSNLDKYSSTQPGQTCVTWRLGKEQIRYEQTDFLKVFHFCRQKISSMSEDSVPR